jgi:hypothetical protein
VSSPPPTSTTRLVVVGLWLGPNAPGWPDVNDFIDVATASEDRGLLADALDGAAATDRAYMGYSTCRVCGRANGSGERTNGAFVRPEGLGHYVREHGVRLPVAVEHGVSGTTSEPERLTWAIAASDDERDDDWWRSFAAKVEEPTARAPAWQGQLQRDYSEVRDWIASVFAGGQAGHYLLEILDDAIAVGLDSVVGLGTSMHDLVFSPLPASSPMDVVVVRAPGSLRAPRQGNVRIEFVTASGHAKAIERPSSDGVALFWRFMREEFGVTRDQPPTANA